MTAGQGAGGYRRMTPSLDGGAIAHARTVARVLVVENDPGDQELMRRGFLDMSIENELHIVNDGEEALDFLLRRGAFVDPATAPRPDLILLDLNMSRMGGREFLLQLKGHDDLIRIPTVVLTTSSREEDVSFAYECGANSYIQKPHKMDEFVALIRSLEHYWFELVILPPA